MNTEQYFKYIEDETNKIYDVARVARAKGLDPVDKVEIPLARSLAERVVGLISAFYPQIENSGVVERILDLEKDNGKLDPMVSFKIAEEVAKQKFCKFSSLIEAIEAGIRIGFAYTTLGVVSSPIEGFTGLTLEKTKEGKEYFVAHFSGPIRSAGTTASCLVLMLIDYLREIFGYAKYDPSSDEVQRYVTENQDYHDRVTNLQYMPTREEIVFLAENIPIQIDGDPTEKMEVSNYKNLERVKTNYIRGGMCLIFSEGLAQKAAKGLRLLKRMKDKGLESTGFDFLEDYIKLHEKRDKGKTDDSPTYINDLVAGRPVFGHPSESGAFRFRYGRGRSSGFSAVSIHPATMDMTDSFIAIGTQLKIEKPTKGCIVTSCDSVDGPIVKLFNGSVRKIKTREESKKLYNDVEEIIYLGDLLFPFSDVANRNAMLLKPGYVEEIWGLEFREKNPEIGVIDNFNIGFEDAIKISEENSVALHPEYIFYWSQISLEQFSGLIEWLRTAKIDKKIILPYSKSDQEKFKDGKRALELLGVEHEVAIENVIINLKNSLSLFSNLGIDHKILIETKEIKNEISEIKKKLEEFSKEKNSVVILEGEEVPEILEGDKVLSTINYISNFKIRDKAGDFIGSRMGRPEKAKLRKLTGSPNVLFPVGNEGGRLRSVQAACETEGVRGEFPLFYCDSEGCKKETIFPYCETCSKKCKKMFYCSECGKADFEICEEHEVSRPHSYRTIDIDYYFKNAIEKLGLTKGEVPPLVKSVRGTSSEKHLVEHLSKGILRAAFDLQVNKDGTIRFDATEMPLVSFKPKEISVSVEKLKELGYSKDIYGKELKESDQILDLKPHDILLPCSPESPDGGADKVFIKICNFIDELLVRFYGLEPIYNVSKREDLVGKLGVFMAPHNCAGVVCRIIGFSTTLGLFASPYMHAAVRRDCDGDEAAIMLLGDVLLNFSREFLPGHRGGTQDAPLVLNAKINAGEVDDQILDFELTYEYPLELYQAAERREHSSKVKVHDVREALANGEDPFVGVGFTHDTSNINDGVACSNYKTLATMQDKVRHQMELVEKIRAANTSETARLIIERHFIKDMRGNLRKFSMQEFRCVGCGEKMRRPPLSGVCVKCRGKIIFTTHEGGIKKYLEPALALAEKYNLSPYIKQSLELTKRHIDSVFGKEFEKQEALEKWF
ncbi:MAG: DNA polymerase II large subunit [Nanoarchaeota archaeon]|nr:DNA polymerase II large subunit [Nanoarchaeota archaeon]MBU1501355.1 DNA polymerase II large subunit [Nanoarchaeota archaeon]